MGIVSINEPGTSRTTMLTPASINEKPQLPDDATDPVIEGIMPETCVIGDPSFTLVVTGTGFYRASVIHFAGYDEPTTLNEDGTLSTGINMALWQGPDTVQVQVKNGDVISNAVDFTFDPPSPAATARHAHEEDPDDLEDEIDEAIEDGDIKPLHAARPKRRKK